MQKPFLFLTVCLNLVLVIRCSTGETEFNNTDLIFTNSVRLSVPAYEYKTMVGKTIHISGDTNYNLALADTIDDMPAMQWDTFKIKVLTCGIFRNPVVVSGGRITNVNDLVWQWHTGMENGKPGRVKYSDGKSVMNGAIDYDQLPTPLLEGNYFWGVWGWNGSATRILYSTRQMKFYVKKSTI